MLARVLISMAQQQHHQQQRRRTRQGGVALVATAAAAFLLFSASRVVAAAAADESAIAAASESAPSLSLGPVFVSEKADDDHRVEASEEEQILASGALESLMQVLDEGDATDAADGDSDARLQAAVEGAQAAAAAAAPVCSSVDSCLALCPTENFLVAGAGGATEGSVEESVSGDFFFLFGERRNHSFSIRAILASFCLQPRPVSDCKKG